MRLLKVLLLTACTALTAFGVVGVAVARYAVLGGRRRRLVILGRPTRELVRLPRIDATTQPATFGLQGEDGRLAVVGGVVALGGSHVDRQIDSDAVLVGGDPVQLVGNVFGPESALARSAAEVTWEASSIVHRVWDFEPETADDGLWFVHVHGLGASPAGTLRSVDAVTHLGYLSTVVSLDGNSDMFARVRGIRAHALERVTASIDHARAGGATRVVLVGWSFGAQLSLQAAAGRDDISGLVLVSPTVDLLATIQSEASVRGIPRVVADLGVSVLTSSGLSRLAGVDRAMKRTADHTEPAERMPLLLLHSAGDQTLSLSKSAATAGVESDVTFVEFPATPHTMEWNADPERFVQVLGDWVSAVVRGARHG